MRYFNRYDIALAFDKANRIIRYEGMSGLAKILYGKLTKPKSITGTYAQWVAQHDTLDEKKCAAIGSHCKTLPYQPLVSVILPVLNTSSERLDRAIQSVQKQLYPHWELVLAGDTSIQPDVKAALANYVVTDARIKVKYQTELNNLSAAGNVGLTLAKGEFVTFLNPNDVLAVHALYYVVETINHSPQASLLYSDEDYINEQGDRTAPYFKCDFNYELFLAQDMISYLAVYCRRLIQQIEGFRDRYDGALLYDLALRAVEHLELDQIVHIPRVLYHRYQPPRSASSLGEESRCQRQALKEHLHRLSIEATVSPAPESPEHHRVQYALPAVLPLVSIIIPTRDRAGLLRVCLDSLLQRSSYPNIEIIIVDNGSTETATTQLFNQLPKDRVRILRDESPFNFSALNNRGVSVGHSAILCLMNNDTEIITTDWLEEMLSFAQRPDIGCVGARLWYPSGFLQHGGVITGIGGIAGHAHLNLRRGGRGYFCRAVLHQSFSAVTAACLVVHRSIFQQVGGFDEALAVAFNDVDFCLRVRQAGFRNIWTPYAELIHHESASRGYETKPHKQARIQAETRLIRERWGDILFNDPAYNPNLSLEDNDFSYAFPPRLADPIHQAKLDSQLA